MGLFNKLKNKNIDYELKCEKRGTDFVNLYVKEKGVSFENVTELERQILAVYFFGMADGLRQNSTVNGNADEVAKIIINIIIKEFKYSKEQANIFLIV